MTDKEKIRKLEAELKKVKKEWSRYYKLRNKPRACIACGYVPQIIYISRKENMARNCTASNPMPIDDLGAPIGLWKHPSKILSLTVSYTNFVDSGSYDVYRCPHCKLKTTIPNPPLVLPS